MVRKPGILLVSTGPLLPPNSGGRIYTWGTTAPLSGEFNYHLISLLTADERAEFTRDRERLTHQYRSAFQSFQFFDRPEIPGHMSRRGATRHLMFHTAHGLPLMDVSYFSHDVVGAAKELVARGGVDMIEVDHAHMAFVRRFIRSVPAVLVNHNIEGDLHPFWMTNRWSLPEKMVWRGFAALSRHNTREVEIRNKYKFAAKLFISRIDADRVGDECPKTVVPVPMATTETPRSGTSDRLRLLWLGGLDWPPNLEGVRWFLSGVLPELLRPSFPPIELHIVGAHPPTDVAAYDNGDSVRVHGYVDDIEHHKSRADVLIAPLFSGSGVNVKVVEALAAGLAVITTTTGVTGLEAVPGRDLLVANSPHDFTREIARLARHPEVRRSLGDNGRAYIRRNHDPVTVAGIKAEALHAALRTSNQPAR
jgi:glycosyltransferase involved in cell wall biosynthesis